MGIEEPDSAMLHKRVPPLVRAGRLVAIASSSPGRNDLHILADELRRAVTSWPRAGITGGPEMVDDDDGMTPEQVRAGMLAWARAEAIRREWKRGTLGLSTDEEVLEWDVLREQEDRAQAHLDKARSWIDWVQIARDRDENRRRDDGCDELRFDFAQLIELAVAELQAAADRK